MGEVMSNMLGSHMISIVKTDRAIIDDLESKGYPCIGKAQSLTGGMYFFALDIHELLPVDSRVATYIISVPTGNSNEPFQIIYSAHPDRRVVDLDRRGTIC